MTAGSGSAGRPRRCGACAGRTTARGAPLAAALLLAVLALLAGAPALAAAVAPPSQHDVEESLTCQCGCGLTVHSCNHVNCGSAEPMKKEIAERIARGESKEQILAAFAQRYGEKVLSAPTFRGFNWLAWITPFAAVAVGGTVLAVAIRRRVRGAIPAAGAPSPAAGGDPVLRARLAHELERLDRE